MFAEIKILLSNSVIWQHFTGKRIVMPKKRHSVINAYTEGEFLLHFRITRRLFNTLSRTFSESAQYKELRPDKRLSSDDHLAIFLWFAGHEGCSFRDLSNRFNVTISTVSRVIVRVTSFLSDLSQQVIKWPTAAEKEASSQYFQTTCGVSGVIGKFLFYQYKSLTF